jgi:hypothetical protein
MGADAVWQTYGFAFVKIIHNNGLNIMDGPDVRPAGFLAYFNVRIPDSIAGYPTVCRILKIGRIPGQFEDIATLILKFSIKILLTNAASCMITKRYMLIRPASLGFIQYPTLRLADYPAISVSGKSIIKNACY